MRFLSIFSKRNILLLCIIVFSNFAGAIKIAVDIGGPTIKLDDKVENLTEGVLESLKILNKHFDVYFLSYGKEAMQNRVKELFHRKQIQHIIPERKWLFVTDREHKAPTMVAEGIKLLIDDDRSQQIEKSLVGKFITEDNKQVPLEFLLFDVNSLHPWQDVFEELKNRGYLDKLPVFKDGIPQE